MSTGQVIMTLGALILSSILVLNANRNLTTTDDSLAQSRYRLEALSIMEAHLQSSSQRFFDEASTDTLSQKLLADFTDPNFLGMEIADNGEIDDFDDYHQQTILDTALSGVIYQLNFVVEYVRLENQAFVQSDSREYHKRMTVKITDNYANPLLHTMIGNVAVRDTLRMSQVFSYWFYN